MSPLSRFALPRLLQATASFGIELDGAIEIDDSGVQIALFCLGKAAVIVNRSILRIELNGAIVVGDSSI